jgi:hypothetical protein
LEALARKKFKTKCLQCQWLEKVVLPKCRGHKKCMEPVLLAMNALGC